MIENHKSIIKASDIVTIKGMAPYRVVLRYDKDDHMNWITHMEDLKIKDNKLVHNKFYNGHYFETREAAEKDFEIRTA